MSEKIVYSGFGEFTVSIRDDETPEDKNATQPPEWPVPLNLYTEAQLQAAVAKARQEERERCAKVCDDVYKDCVSKDLSYQRGWEFAAETAEERIRQLVDE